MEGMNTEKAIESKLWRNLEKNGIADLSQYHQPHVCDEVPLVLRAADIGFLANYSRDDASAILLRFALKFLKSVISYEEHHTPYFASITVAEQSADDPFIPHVFVWSDPALELYENLKLSEPTTAFGKKVKRLVMHLELPDIYGIYEDTLTTPDSTRVFIAPLHPPYPGFVPIYMFCKPRKEFAPVSPVMKSARRTTR